MKVLDLINIFLKLRFQEINRRLFFSPCFQVALDPEDLPRGTGDEIRLYPHIERGLKEARPMRVVTSETAQRESDFSPFWLAISLSPPPKIARCDLK